MPDVKKVNSGLLEFGEDLQVFVAVDEDGEVQKAVTIDEDGDETSFVGITPTGKISITQNGTNIDVAQYAKADVAVPQPTGKITITENGEDIDIAQYATADVAVPAPASDFSTAEVTFADYSLENSDYEQAELPLTIPCPNINNNVINESFTITNFTDTMTVPLYKGHAVFNETALSSGIPAVSGNIVRTEVGEIPDIYININIAGNGVLKLGFPK